MIGSFGNESAPTTLAGDRVKSFIFAALVLALGTNVHAQLRKCTAPDGKVTYSDFLCNTSSTEGTIKNPNGNSLDASGSRQQAQRSQVNEEPAINPKSSSQSAPTECKFSYYAVGDEKGKVLAANAKQECLRNNEAKKEGRETSLEHYNFWKDHQQMMSTKRSANRPVNCMPNGFGGMRCN